MLQLLKKYRIEIKNKHKQICVYRISAIFLKIHVHVRVLW